MATVEIKLYWLKFGILATKSNKGIIGTEMQTSIGFKTSHGSSLDHKGPCKTTMLFFRLFRAVFKFSIKYIFKPL